MPSRPSGDNPIAAPVPSALCARVRSRVFDYLEGSLRDDERRRMDAHLAACAGCRTEIALARRSERALASVLDAAPDPGDLRPGFYARLAASPRTTPRLPRRTLAPALSVALLALALALRHSYPGHPVDLIQKPAAAPIHTALGARSATPAPPWAGAAVRALQGRDRGERYDFLEQPAKSV